MVKDQGVKMRSMVWDVLNLACVLDIQMEMLGRKLSRLQGQTWAKRHKSGSHQFLDGT